MGFIKKIKKEDTINNKRETIPGTCDTERFGYELRQLIEKYDIGFQYNGFGFTEFKGKDGSRMGVAYLITKVLGCEPHKTWENLIK